MSMAYLVSSRATCDRKMVGSVITVDNRIIATGYNGAAAKMPQCDEVGHELKMIDGRESCVRTLHAESNALDFAGSDSQGGVLYSNVIPCYDCAKRIVNAGILMVVWAEYYASRNTDLVIEYFNSSKCKLVEWKGEIIKPIVPDLVNERSIALRSHRTQTS